MSPRKKMWWEPSKPEELQPVPWLAPQVIQYLKNIIMPDWNVIEHGSGGSTLWFAEKVATVTAQENDPAWQRAVARQAPDNLALVVANFLRAMVMSWDKFDLLLIDGEPLEDRTWWIENATKIVKPGGWVVLDNANHAIFKEAKCALQDASDFVQVFDNNEGGTEYLVTEFYRLKTLAPARSAGEGSE